MRPTWEKYFMEIAKQVAKRSTCIRRQVGAVVVDKQNVIVATGYNGPVRKAPHCVLPECINCRFISEAEEQLFCLKSEMVIAAPKVCNNWKRADNLSVTVCTRELQDIPHGARYDDCPGVHAEANALLFSGKKARNSTLYITSWPCFQCAKLMVNAEIERVVYSCEEDFTHEELELKEDVKKFLEKFIQVEEW